MRLDLDNLLKELNLILDSDKINPRAVAYALKVSIKDAPAEQAAAVFHPPHERQHIQPGEEPQGEAVRWVQAIRGDELWQGNRYVLRMSDSTPADLARILAAFNQPADTVTVPKVEHGAHRELEAIVRNMVGNMERERREKLLVPLKALDAARKAGGR